MPEFKQYFRTFCTFICVCRASESQNNTLHIPSSIPLPHQKEDIPLSSITVCLKLLIKNQSNVWLASISCNPSAIWLNAVVLKHGLNTKADRQHPSDGWVQIWVGEVAKNPSQIRHIKPDWRRRREQVRLMLRDRPMQWGTLF